MSAITQAELDDLILSGLPDDTPYVIEDVSRGFFSIARHSGGAVFNGRAYVYEPPTDRLIRKDVLKYIMQQRKAAEREARRAAKAGEQDMFDDPEAAACR